jgi:hypothetical protein
MSLIQANAGAIGTGAAALAAETILGQTKHRSTVRLAVNIGAAVFNSLKAKMDAQDAAQAPVSVKDDPMAKAGA